MLLRLMQWTDCWLVDIDEGKFKKKSKLNRVKDHTGYIIPSA